MEDKRQHKRFVVEGTDIHGHVLLTPNVEILDISMGGVSIKTDKRLNMGSQYTLKLEDEGKSLTLKGTVVWCSITGSRKGPHGETILMYKAGMQFHEVFSSKMLELLDFIKDHSHKALKEQRLGGIRFAVKAEGAMLDYPQHYLLKKISLGGMLIETAQPMEIETKCPMELIFPDDKEPVRFMGRVASCTEIVAGASKHFDIGIEFFDLSDKDKEKIKKFTGLTHIEKQTTVS